MKILGAGVIGLAALAVAGCAASGAVEKFREITRADVQRGLEIATAAKDPAGEAGAAAILAHLPDDATVSPAPAGAFSTFMAAREVRRKAQTGIPEAIHAACAVLILDAELTLGRLGLAVVPGGGLVRALGR